MSFQSWQETLATAQVDGAALSNSASATSILPAQAKYTLPAGWCQIGRMLQVTAMGRVSNIVTTPGTLTLDIRFGSIVVFTGGAMSLNVVAKTNVTWMAALYLTVRAIGSGTSANLMGVGTFTSESAVSSVSGEANTLSMPASAPAVGTGFDSTVANQVDMFATFSTANAGNALTLHGFALAAMN